MPRICLFLKKVPKRPHKSGGFISRTTFLHWSADHHPSKSLFQPKHLSRCFTNSFFWPAWKQNTPKPSSLKCNTISSPPLASCHWLAGSFFPLSEPASRSTLSRVKWMSTSNLLQSKRRGNTAAWKLAVRSHCGGFCCFSASYGEVSNIPSHFLPHSDQRNN